MKNTGMMTGAEQAAISAGAEDQPIPEGARLRYLLYRCEKCNRILTALQIEARWAKGEKRNEGRPTENQVHPQCCPCGSRHMSPTNATWFEEMTSPAILRVWLLRVVLPWVRDNGLHTFWTKR